MNELNEPKKADGIPAEAKWNAADGEWELGEKNKEQQSVGEWKWWREDGSLLCHSSYNDEGQLEGIIKRFHPNGELSQWARYHEGKIFGKQVYTKVSTGESPENLNFPPEPEEMYRWEMIFKDGEIQPIYTLYNIEGSKNPIEFDEEGNSIDLGNQLHKLIANTVLMMKGEFLQPINEKAIKIEKGTFVTYAGPSSNSKSIYLIRIEDPSGTFDGSAEIELTAEEIQDKLTLAVDKVDMDISKQLSQKTD